MKQYKIMIFLILLCIISASFLSLNGNFTSDENYVLDSLGRRVKIAQYNRIGIINPAALKSLTFLGFENSKIVGVDSYSLKKYQNYLDPKTENLGDFNNPNIEIIVKTKIDLLILDQSFPIQKLYEIEKLKIPYFVYSTSIKGYSDLYSNLFNLSKLIKKERECEKLKKQLIEPYEEKILKIKGRFENKSIMVVVWADKNLTCSGIDSYLSYLAEFCGFKNSISEKGWINISFENLLILNPDYIIIASTFIDKNFFENPIFKNLKAKINNNIYFFDQSDEDKILQPSFDLWEGFYNIISKFR